jgi:predicted nuclease with TOPRIM domain
MNKPSIRETLKSLGYEDPEKIIRSRVEEDQDYVQYLIKTLAKSEKEHDAIKAEIAELRDRIAFLSNPETDSSEMEDAIKKWREVYDLEPNTSRVDLHTLIDREDHSYSVQDGKMIRTITTFYADGSNSMQRFAGV